MKTLILGVGNTIRGDDVIGLLVAREIADRNLPGVTVIECESAGFEILDHMPDYDKVIIIDAMKTDNPEEVGEIITCGLDEGRPTVTLLPSHGFDFAGLLKTYRQALPRKFPEDIRFILIKVKEVDEFREGVSSELEKKLDEVYKNVIFYLNNIISCDGSQKY